ncbi:MULTISPECIES: autotransporter-associated beta strand repeat-containing protein [Bombella]|uniref:Autotransporter-associated beta strand repeat-containing protein n=1 Tax=Bombella pollinis TaxID=2967337 RepID=A0ABT3WNY1_9PROT|nr:MULTISPECIES: autotransporter-associated beta strand repeat-containing protein [Bombella]MCX5619544.1 autotransporter-associated beta strand repeat-containing protein [Bombella pollinis]MUG04253.1 hypothetical protein [Bombella sp. ESL0378]
MGGVLQIASDQSLGAAGTALNIDGGTLRLGGDVTTNRTVILGAFNNYAGLDLNGHTGTLKGSIVGPGQKLEVWGNRDNPSVLNINGNNTYTGDTYFKGSFNDASFPTKTTINANSDTPFGASSSDAHGGTVFVGNATLNVNNHATLGYHSIINDGGTINLNSADTNGHADINNRGGYGINAVLNVNNASSVGASTITNNNGGIINLNDSSRADAATIKNNGGAINAVGGSGVGSLSGNGGGTISLKGTFTVGALNQDDTLDSVIQNDSSKNAGSLVKVGTGTQTLTGNNSYTGSTNVNEGTLALAGQGSIAQSASIDIEQQGSFDISKAASDETVNTISGSGSVILGKNTLNIVNANYIKPYFGSISGSGGVNLFRGGVFFSGQNTYTGLTDVKGGDFHLDGSIAGDLLNETTTKIGDQPQGKVSVGGDIKNLGALTIRNATIHNISSDAGASTFLGNVVAEGDISSKSDFVFGDTNKDKDNDVTAFSYNTGKGNRTTLNGNLILTQAHGAINGWVLGVLG